MHVVLSTNQRLTSPHFHPSLQIGNGRPAAQGRRVKAYDLKRSRNRRFRPKESGTAHDATSAPIAADPGRCRASLWPAVRDGTGSRRFRSSFPPDHESFSTSRKLPRECGSGLTVFEHRGAGRIDRSRQATQVIAVSRRFKKWAWPLQPTAVTARSPAWLDGSLASTERRALQARCRGLASRRMPGVDAKSGLRSKRCQKSADFCLIDSFAFHFGQLVEFRAG